MIQSDESEVILCPKCNGRGKILMSKRVSAYDTNDWYEICETCGGKRVVEVVTTVEVHQIKEDNNV